MEWWKQGKLEELLSECEAVQTRLKKSLFIQHQKTIRLESLLVL